MNRIKVRLLILLFIFYLLIPVFILLQDIGHVNLIYQIGKTMGIVGISLLVIQMILSSRFKFIEKGVGHNNLIVFHKYEGISALTLLLLHPIFLFFGTKTSGLTLVEYLRTWGIFQYLGLITLLSLIVTVVFALYSDEFRIKYEVWRMLHKLTFLVILLGLVHSFFLGTDIISRSPIYYWWIFLAILATLTFIGKYVIRYFLLKRSLYKVISVKKETTDVRSIFLEPVNGKIFDYKPGQFAYTIVNSPGLPKEEHHFTISSSPEDANLAFTIKESGDYTSLLGKIREGDLVRIEGPFGVFTNLGIKPPYLFIAGGIGITPFMSMLRYARKKGNLGYYILIYSVKTQKELVFKNELEEMRKEGLKLYPVLSQEKVKYYYYGRIDINLLKRFIKGKKNASIYLVGPGEMMKSVKKDLTKLGIKKGKIFTERFFLK
jgi:3-phenylpropionate/trans-cinnamate dioxygenase ferredoxin reductase subunit